MHQSEMKYQKVIIPLFANAYSVLKFNSLFQFLFCRLFNNISVLPESEYDDVQQDFFSLSLCVSLTLSFFW